MTRKLTCIICPNGCEITAEYDGAAIHSITGASCRKGKEYVQQELMDPCRNLATSVLVENAELPLVSVRLNHPIPKGEIFRVMEAINTLHLRAPLQIGQVALSNVCGLEADVIVTKNVAKQE